MTTDTAGASHLDPEALAAYLDEGLPAGERAQAAEHLADCRPCRARLAAQIRAEGRGAEPVVLAERRAPAWVPLLAAAAVGALLLGVGLWLAVGDGGRGGVAERAPAPATPRAPAEADVEALAPGIEEPTHEELARPPRRQPPAEGGVEPPALPEELLALRGATRRIEGKTFRLEAGEWVDSDYRAPDQGSPTEVRRGTAEHQALLAHEPRAAQWQEAGPRVVVLVDSIPYRIVDADAR